LPAFVLSEALTLAALVRWSGEITLPPSPDLPRPPSFAVESLESAMAELTASRIGWLPSTVKPPWLVSENLPVEAWTACVIASMQ
jgi:hypothetical protein